MEQGPPGPDHWLQWQDSCQLQLTSVLAPFVSHCNLILSAQPYHTPELKGEAFKLALTQLGMSSCPSTVLYRLAQTLKQHEQNTKVLINHPFSLARLIASGLMPCWRNCSVCFSVTSAFCMVADSYRHISHPSSFIQGTPASPALKGKYTFLFRSGMLFWEITKNLNSYLSDSCTKLTLQHLL